MPKDYLDFHPYRFQLLTAAADARQELSQSGNRTASQVTEDIRQNQFAGMTRAEFEGRLELMTEMRHAWSRWSGGGSEILDFSDDMAQMAGSKIVEVPWTSPLVELHPVYVHFGSEAALILDDSSRLIEGAYLQTADDPLRVLVHLVCNDVSRDRTLGSALIAQSEVIKACLDRNQNEFIEFDGDHSLVAASLKPALLSRVLYVVAHVLGPCLEMDTSPRGLERLLLN